MKLTVFLLICFIHCTVGESGGPHRRYAVQEENKNRLSYFLVETADGSYEIEDLTTNYDIEVKASLSDVIYYFYTRTNRNGTVVNNITERLSTDIFNPQKEVIVTIHGWRNDHTSPFNSDIKSAILDQFDVNVIVVDWGSIAHLGYITARNSVPQIGKFVGEFLQTLVSTYKIPLSKISIVGHSLGAHAAGITGSTFHGEIDHIVGLDPAGPLISVLEKDYCLDSSDAKYVQVIHTNTAFLGLTTSLGHSDYFPNGGKKQPGCGLDLTGSCSHGRAYRYYAESIRKDKFISQECVSYSDFVNGRCNGNYSLMGGYHINKKIYGDFYLTTNENYPYAIN